MLVRLIGFNLAPLILMAFGGCLLNTFLSFQGILWIWNLVFLLICSLIPSIIYSIFRNSDQLTAIILGCTVAKLLLALIYILVLKFLFTDAFLMLSMHFLVGFVFFSVSELFFVKCLMQSVKNALPRK